MVICCTIKWAKNNYNVPMLSFSHHIILYLIGNCICIEVCELLVH